MRRVLKLLVFAFLIKNGIECHKSNADERSEAFDAIAEASKNTEEMDQGLKSKDFETTGMFA